MINTALSSRGPKQPFFCVDPQRSTSKASCSTRSSCTGPCTPPSWTRSGTRRGWSAPSCWTRSPSTCGAQVCSRGRQASLVAALPATGAAPGPGELLWHLSTHILAAFHCGAFCHTMHGTKTTWVMAFPRINCRTTTATVLTATATVTLSLRACLFLCYTPITSPSAAGLLLPRAARDGLALCHLSRQDTSRGVPSPGRHRSKVCACRR